MTPNNETENRKWSLPKLTMKETLLSTASVILTALFMPMFMYSSNCAEANLSELVMPMLLFSAMAVVMLFVLFLFTRSISKAALISVLMTLVLENYSFIEKCIRYVFPQLKYWHILPICIVVVLHIGYLLFRVLKEDIAKYVPFISTVVFGGLIVVNLVTAVPSIINKMSTDTLVSDDSGEVIKMSIQIYTTLCLTKPLHLKPSKIITIMTLLNSAVFLRKTISIYLRIHITNLQIHILS